MEKRELTCIQCPLSCRITTSGVGDHLKFTGNQCKEGLDYARREVTNPTRILTTTVATVFPDFPVLPVRTSGEVPLGKILDVMQLVKEVVVDKRLRPGDVIMERIPGTDRGLVATADMCEGAGAAAVSC